MAASSATIGALSVIIGGDASALDKMLSGATSSINGFAAKVGQIAGGIGLEKAIEKVVSSIVEMVQKGLESAAAMSKMAKATGDSVVEVSRLKYAADVVGV